jgi:hypothetical protein
MARMPRTLQMSTSSTKPELSKYAREAIWCSVWLTKNIKAGKVKEALQWIRTMSYALPEEDRRKMLMYLIAKYPSDLLE